MNYNNITDNYQAVKLLKERLRIEKEIQRLDDKALIKYELEKLAETQANDINIEKSNCDIPVVIERDLLEKITGELTEYALALNGDICMPTEATEMMSSKHRVLNLVKRLNHAL